MFFRKCSGAIMGWAITLFRSTDPCLSQWALEMDWGIKAVSRRTARNASNVPPPSRMDAHSQWKGAQSIRMPNADGQNRKHSRG